MRVTAQNFPHLAERLEQPIEPLRPGRVVGRAEVNSFDVGAHRDSSPLQVVCSCLLDLLVGGDSPQPQSAEHRIEHQPYHGEGGALQLTFVQLPDCFVEFQRHINAPDHQHGSGVGGVSVAFEKLEQLCSDLGASRGNVIEQAHEAGIVQQPRSNKNPKIRGCPYSRFVRARGPDRKSDTSRRNLGANARRWRFLRPMMMLPRKLSEIA